MFIDRQTAHIASLAAAELLAHNERIAIAQDAAERSIALFRTTNARDLKPARFLRLIVPLGLFAQHGEALKELEGLRQNVTPLPSVEEHEAVRSLSLAVSERLICLVHVNEEIAVMEIADIRDNVDAITSAARLGVSHLVASGAVFNKVESLKKPLKKQFRVTPAAISKTLKSWSSRNDDYWQLLTGLKLIIQK
jgi:dsDNA-specific endonuclease/ATPase MutS2